jgi:cellulose synthase/poly-beta-1,6-N-acetylglucosamine synthase-like glycosyltransferase
LAFSICMICIIGFKFIAALQFGKPRQPENHDRFVVLQVPCYTEGEESLRECFESLASLKYDDKRKLLFVICDGMIIGSGNDRPTPRIVLDILGADPALDPEPLSFQSLGEGSKQHNMVRPFLRTRGTLLIPYLRYRPRCIPVCMNMLDMSFHTLSSSRSASRQSALVLEIAVNEILKWSLCASSTGSTLIRQCLRANWKCTIRSRTSLVSPSIVHASDQIVTRTSRCQPNLLRVLTGH